MQFWPLETYQIQVDVWLVLEPQLGEVPDDFNIGRSVSAAVDGHRQ